MSNSYIANFLKYKDFLIELIRKDIKLKYRNSFLGILWSMLNPLLLMIVLTIIFSSVFERDIPNFPVYVLIGRLLYAYFAESTNFAMDSIRANGQLIRKVYVPKYFFPLSRICSSFIVFLLSFIPLLIVMLITGIHLSIVNLLVIFPLLYIFLICTGIGLALSAITVFFQDIKHLYGVVLTLLMFMTPIFYPVEIIPSEYLPMIKLNPLFEVVQMMREVLMYGSVPSLQSHLICIGYGFVCLIVGLFLFYKAKDKFIFYI